MEEGEDARRSRVSISDGLVMRMQGDHGSRMQGDQECKESRDARRSRVSI